MCQRAITTGLLSSPKHLITDLSGLKIRKLFHQCFTHILNSIWLIYYVCNCLSSLLLSHTRPFPFLNVNPTIKTIKNIISYSFSIRNRSTRESFSFFLGKMTHKKESCLIGSSNVIFYYKKHLPWMVEFAFPLLILITIKPRNAPARKRWNLSAGSMNWKNSTITRLLISQNV